MTYGVFFDPEGKKQILIEKDLLCQADNFWGDQKKAAGVLSEISGIRNTLDQWSHIESRRMELVDFLALLEEEEDEELLLSVSADLKKFEKDLLILETESFLSGEFDLSPAFLYIKPGAGGTESQDWAEMMFRMYCRFFEDQKWKFEVLEHQEDAPAGIKSALVHIKNPYAFGYLRGEKGVHRLVRVSPFDANHRRHTSFCAVDVFPEVEEEVEIEIKDADLRTDTYRASGAGGQHVNKTDSAVRLTHIPTGIVVACQTERSQHSNRATALKILKSRLFQHALNKKKEDLEKIRSEKTDNSFGHQIRNYTLHPYNLVKDLRTDEETSDTRGVMDGALLPFLQAFIRWDATEKVRS